MLPEPFAPRPGPVTPGQSLATVAEPGAAGPSTHGVFRLPAAVARLAAEAAGTKMSVVTAAVELAVAGGPDVVDPGWFARAACTGVSRQVFYPTQRSPRKEFADIRDAVCRRCPVRPECLASALAAGETVGYWGNVGPTGLRRLRQVLRAGGVIAGTGEAAYVSWCEPDAGVSERAPGPAGLAVVPSPWPHQAAAVDAVAAAIAAGGVCQVAMASGSGKTNVALWAARHMGCRSVLVLVPALGLVEQVSAVWRRLWPEARQLGFCSDTGGVRSALNLAATTDPADAAPFLAAPGPAVLISTYQSSPALATAALAGLDWDAIIADEAHHVAGAADKAYAAVLRGEIPARRVLYLTATPRSYARAGGDVTVVGMDDPAFGPRVFDFGLDAAIDAAVVADYRIVVAAVEAEVFQAVAARPEMAGIDPHLLAGAIAVVRAISEMGLNSCVSFHSRVERARTFASLIGPVAEALGEARPAGPGWSGYVHGGASVHIRGRLLARLGDPGSWGVLANARALGEGVDLPTLDCVAIVDPRNSEVDVLHFVPTYT